MKNEALYMAWVKEKGWQEVTGAMRWTPGSPNDDSVQDLYL